MKTTKKMLLLVLSFVLAMAVALPAMAFSDTASLDSETQKAITRLADLKIINGYEDGTFKPGDNITRAEMAKILQLLAKQKTGKTPETANCVLPYTDVKMTDWFYEHIAVATTLNLMKGDSEGTFRPNDTINKGEVVTTLVRLLGYEDDGSAGVWPQYYMKKASDIKLTLQADGIYVNLEKANRGYVAKLAARALDLPMADGTTKPETKPEDKPETSTKDVEFGFIKDFGFTAKDIDNGVRFFGDDKDYQIQKGSATPVKNAIFAYDVSGNEVHITKVDTSKGFSGKIISTDGNLITTTNGQCILNSETTVMQVEKTDGDVTSVDKSYTLAVGDSVDIRYQAGQNDNKAAYVIAYK